MCVFSGFCWLLASIGFWLLLAFGFYWLLAFGFYWLLASVGFCWLLASIGFWLLLAFGRGCMLPENQWKYMKNLKKRKKIQNDRRALRKIRCSPNLFYFQQCRAQPALWNLASLELVSADSWGLEDWLILSSIADFSKELGVEPEILKSCWRCSVQLCIYIDINWYLCTISFLYILVI